MRRMDMNNPFELNIAVSPECTDFRKVIAELDKEKIRAKYPGKDRFGKKILPGDRISKWKGTWVLVDKSSYQRHSQMMLDMRREERK